MANISARAIRERAPDLLPVLKPEGILVASGIIQEQHEESQQALADAGFGSIEVWPREDWISLVCRAN